MRAAIARSGTAARGRGLHVAASSRGTTLLLERRLPAPSLLTELNARDPGGVQEAAKLNTEQARQI